MEEDVKNQTLKDYLTKIIDDFREKYNKLDEFERKLIEPNTIYTAPCQIEIFWVTEPSEFQLFVLFHDPDRRDKEIIINGPFNVNEITEKVIDLMEEPRWRKKSLYKEDLWPSLSDVGFQEHKYSDEFVGHFSSFLEVILRVPLLSLPPGLVMSQYMGETDYCIIFKGNIAELPLDELNQNSTIEYAKQHAASFKNGLMQEIVQSKNVKKEQNARKFFGAHYYPGVRIGNDVELSFREKLSGSKIFEYPKFEYEFSFNGRTGFFDRYGLVLIESESETEAIKIINTIFGVSIIHGVETFSIRESDIITTEIPLDSSPLGKPIGSYSRKISEITGQPPNFFRGLKRTQITIEKMKKIINISEKIFRNDRLNGSLLFLLESNTHLKNSEFSQAYIFCWLIVEQDISKKFKVLLSEKKEGEKKERNKNPNKIPNIRKLEKLHCEGKLDDQHFTFLTGYNQKRNDFVHSGKIITESDAKNLFNFAFGIIQNEIMMIK